MTAMLHRVAEYVALGEHRTGGPADEATVAWMAGQLAGAGLEVESRPVAYPGWVGTSALQVDGAPVEHLLVPYGWTGSVDTDDVVIGSFDPRSGGLPSILDEAVAAHSTDGRPLVLATEHPDGELVGVNRHDLGVHWDHPVVLCAGRDLPRLQSGRVSVAATGAVREAETANLIARNQLPGAPLVLTTPLNGWFGCAGERGTGIAVLLELVERLADLPLLVFVTAGHELGYFGVHSLLPWLQTQRMSSVFHVGASVAVLGEPSEQGARELATTRVAFTSTCPSRPSPCNPNEPKEKP